MAILVPRVRRRQAMRQNADFPTRKCNAETEEQENGRGRPVTHLRQVKRGLILPGVRSALQACAACPRAG